jgi:hypothetical protein
LLADVRSVNIRRFREFRRVRQSGAATSWQLIAALIREKGWNKKRFCDNTLLDEFVFDRAMSNHRSTPSLRTLMAICAGMDLGLSATDALLGASGFRLNNSKEHLAFEYIIRDMAGLPLWERNTFLASVGIEPLGSKSGQSRPVTS